MSAGDDGTILANGVGRGQREWVAGRRGTTRVTESDGEVHWRTKPQWRQPPAGKMIASAEDLEAKYRVKRGTEWTGYLVHLTETCALVIGDIRKPHRPRLPFGSLAENS